MKTAPSRVLGAAVVLALALAGACGSHRRPLPPPAPLARERLDLGVACLAAGRVEPPLERLTEAELVELAELVARTVAAYQDGDHASFLALRWGDLAHADRARAESTRELRGHCRRLGVASEELGGSWTELLAAYWRAYYAAGPPVARFLPEATVLARRAQELDARALADWEASFERLRGAGPGAAIDHQLAVPHRRPIAEVAADPGPLRWLDLELGFEAHDGTRGRLIARFVWDGAEGEWFLHRATTLSDGERRDDARFLVL